MRVASAHPPNARGPRLPRLRGACPASARLFPDWKRSPSVQKGYSQARWIRNNEDYLPSLTKRVPRPTFYSLRHTFKTRLAISRVPAQFQNALLGHAQVGWMNITSTLTKDRSKGPYSAISGISYPGAWITPQARHRGQLVAVCKQQDTHTGNLVCGNPTLRFRWIFSFHLDLRGLNMQRLQLVNAVELVARA